jgi:hypothetical protein
MIARDLLQASEAALLVANCRPQMLPAVLDRLADETDRLLELQGEPAAPLRHAGLRIAAHLVRARAAHPTQPEAVLEALQSAARQATLVLRLVEVLPMVPPPAVPPHWRTQAHARPRFAVVQGGRA